jgi:PAS domain S-box-containing protein
MFRAIVEASIQGMIVHRDQKPLFVNDSWAELHGLTREDVLEMDNVLSLIHPAEQPRLLGYMKARMRGEEAPTRYEYRGVHRDGSVIWLENLVRVVPWCGKPAVLASIVDVTKRRQTEQALRESEERFRKGFEDGPIGVIFQDSELRIVRANRAFCDLIGASEDELKGLTTIDLSLPEDLQAGNGQADITVGSFNDFTIRKRYQRRDKGIVWVRVTAHWSRNDDGAPACRMSLVENVTDRVQARLAVEASERRFRNLVEGSIQGILVHCDNRPLFVNDAWQHMMGYSYDEVMQAATTLDFIAPHDRERIAAYREARIKGEPAPNRYEYQGVRKNGSMIWLENSVRMVEWDGHQAIQSTIIDCTERKLREQELETFNEELERRVQDRTSELETTNEQLQKEIIRRSIVELQLRDSRATYESLVETIPLCVARKDLEGRFVFANRALRLLMGKSLDEIVGHFDEDFSPPELAEKYKQDDRRVIETGEQLDFVEQSNLETSGERHIHTLKTPIRDADGNISGTQLIFWDITEQVLASRAAREAQEEVEIRNRDLTSLLYVISHDLKEPVRAIQSFSALVAKYAGERLDEKSAGYLQRVIDASSRMQQLLDDVLTLSRAQRTVEPNGQVDCNAIVREVQLQLQARIEESQAIIDVASDLPIVRGDRRWLTQAVQNLIANALKFRANDAPPKIRVSAWQPETSESPAFKGLVVSDRGPGVDEQHRERIFELFQRAVGRSIEGTGAGLAIVRQVAERHGGTAFVTPREGGGSHFVITVNDAWRPD